MFNNLLKPAWEHKNPERRIAAIETFSETDTEKQVIAAQIVENDESNDVRAAAAALLLDLKLLNNLSEKHAFEAAKTRRDALVRSKEDTHQLAIAEYLEKEGDKSTALLRYFKPLPGFTESLEVFKPINR